MTINVFCSPAETPDSISISLANHTGPMVEGREYQLLCEVQNIAPVQYLTLRWYRGQTEVYNHTFSELSPATPVQVSSTLLINPGRVEDGAPYRCEATLELGPEGPQPPPKVKSEPLSITVHCKTIQTACSSDTKHYQSVLLMKVIVKALNGKFPQPHIQACQSAKGFYVFFFFYFCTVTMKLTNQRMKDRHLVSCICIRIVAVGHTVACTLLTNLLYLTT